jgi:hypothetical protein
MKKHAAPIIAAILLFLPVIYVGSYFALVKPGYSTIQEGSGTASVTSDLEVSVTSLEAEYLDPTHPTYRIQSQWISRIFWPLKQADRTVRPRLWSPETLRGPERHVSVRPGFDP